MLLLVLSITSFIGTSYGASHYYGIITPYEGSGDAEGFEVFRTIDGAEATILNRVEGLQDDSIAAYRDGDTTIRFNDQESLFCAALRAAKEEFGDDFELRWGRGVTARCVGWDDLKHIPIAK